MQQLDFDFYEKKKTREKTKSSLTKRTNSIEVDGIDIKLKLTSEDYDILWNKAYFGE